MSESADQLIHWIDSLPTWGKAAVAGGTALVLYIPYRFWSTRPRQSPYKQDFEKDVVYLYQFPRSNYVPNLSPYCLKVETWLRMSDIKYEIPKIGWNIRSKEGTLPFVEYNGIEYYDSSFIIRDLDQQISQPSIDDHLSEEQKATTRAFETLVEKSSAISFWVPRLENASKAVESFHPSVFGIFGPFIKHLTSQSYASTLTARLAATDFGSHSRQDRINIGLDDLRAISTYLGNKHFFHGFKPTKVDACIFANLSLILYAPYDSEHRDVIRAECQNLVEYVERIKNRFWPDWIESTTKYSTDTNWKKRPVAIKNGKNH